MFRFKRPSRLTIFLILVVVFAVWFAIIDPPTPEELSPVARFTLIGHPSHEFDDLIAKVEEDIKNTTSRDVQITVFVGPYSRIGQLDSSLEPYFYILLDEVFLNSLTPKERDALVAHEAGHVLFRYANSSSRKAMTGVQIQADMFALRYVDPKDLISLLDKIYYDYLARKSYLEIVLNSLEL